jgi:hypothetical protein
MMPQWPGDWDRHEALRQPAPGLRAEALTLEHFAALCDQLN